MSGHNVLSRHLSEGPKGAHLIQVSLRLTAFIFFAISNPHNALEIYWHRATKQQTAERQAFERILNNNSLGSMCFHIISISDSPDSSEKFSHKRLLRLCKSL